MMQYEFERIAGYHVTTEDYDNIIEPMYMAIPESISKQDFIKMLDRKRFSLDYRKKKLQKEMQELAQHLKETCTHFTDWEAKDKLAELSEEYQKLVGGKGYHIAEECIWTCYYPVKVQIYSKDYITIATVQLF